MAVQEIPRAFKYVCDVCRTEHLQENASGHYTNSTPKYWARLVIKQDAYDYQGAAVADGSIERLLCSDCRSGVIAAINTWTDERRAALAGSKESDAAAAVRDGGRTP